MKVTTTEITRALGISDSAVRKRAQKDALPITGDRIQGGGYVYNLERLPLSKTDRIKIGSRVLLVADFPFNGLFKFFEPPLKDNYLK